MSKWFEEFKFISTLHDHAGKFHIISLYICMHIHWILASQDRLLCLFILDRKIRPNLWVSMFIFPFLHICYMYIKYIYIFIYGQRTAQHLHFLILEGWRCHIDLESNVMYIAHIYKNTYTSISRHFHPSKLFCFFGKITWIFSPSSSLYAWGYPFLQSQARIALVRHLIDKVGSAQLLLRRA